MERRKFRRDEARNSRHGRLGLAGVVHHSTRTKLATSQAIRANIGGASRFFYTGKVKTGEREAGLAEGTVNDHPTLKPIALAEYLATLLLPLERETPRRLLTPFSGAGSEMIGALRAGWESVVGIEGEEAYMPIAMPGSLGAYSLRS